jgi:hypothetical protein
LEVFGSVRDERVTELTADHLLAISGTHGLVVGRDEVIQEDPTLGAYSLASSSSV